MIENDHLNHFYSFLQCGISQQSMEKDHHSQPRIYTFYTAGSCMDTIASYAKCFRVSRFRISAVGGIQLVQHVDSHGRVTWLNNKRRSCWFAGVPKPTLAPLWHSPCCFWMTEPGIPTSQGLQDTLHPWISSRRHPIYHPISSNNPVDTAFNMPTLTHTDTIPKSNRAIAAASQIRPYT